MFYKLDIFSLKSIIISLFIIFIPLTTYCFSDKNTLKLSNNKPVENESEEALFDNEFSDELLLSRVKKITNRVRSEKNLNHESEKPIENVKEQQLDTKLLNDNEITGEENLESSKKASPDVIIRYDNAMFGLVDLEPTLHVWRAPFVSLGQIWPHPWSLTSAHHIFTICTAPGSLKFRVTGMDNYVIQHAINRCKEVLCGKMVSFYPSNWRDQERILDEIIYGQKIFKTSLKSITQYFDHNHYLSAYLKGEITTVSIFAETHGNQWPSLFMNESYHLSVNKNGISIHAKETWGVIRALESISQLAWRTRAGRVFINESKIIDQPRFKHRGLMLDTARHFIPKNIILKNLDAMSMNKLNVFHWHISDDQSFPLVTDNHPEFAKYGSYDFRTKTYRPDDVREILEHARLRGIRVIPEIDSPSHSLSWRKSHPEVMTRCIDKNGQWTGYYGPVNMAAQVTYRLLKSLFTDIVHLFPDQWIHLGSDEVAIGCVASNPAIDKWMKSKGMTSIDLLADFYTRKLQNIITEIGYNNSQLQRGYIVWQEAYDRNSKLKKDTIVQLWKSQSTVEAATLAGQKTFVIYSACWYLDHLEYGAQWAKHYHCDPCEDYGTMMMPTLEWQEYILGGEMAMWTEFFDADNVLQRIWPLACAASERLWSPNTVLDLEKAATRLEEMQCRMLTRSIPVGVASGAGDCGQDLESSVPDAFHRNPSQNSVILLADASSIRLLYQITVNLLFNRVSLFAMFLMVTLVCICLNRRIRGLNRRTMIMVIFVLGIYSFLWIATQHSLLIVY